MFSLHSFPFRFHKMFSFHLFPSRSHKRIVSLSPVLASLLPLGLNATLQTTWFLSQELKTLRLLLSGFSEKLSKFHIRTVPFAPVVASSLPSGLKLMLLTSPWSVFHILNFVNLLSSRRKSHTPTVPFAPATASC